MMSQHPGRVRFDVRGPFLLSAAGPARLIRLYRFFVIRSLGKCMRTIPIHARKEADEENAASSHCGSVCRVLLIHAFRYTTNMDTSVP
jgi:hypothetical protein